MLSNHNTPFINELYKDFRKEIVLARRAINSDASKRGAVEESIILNY
jgi:DNA adenine methylase